MLGLLRVLVFSKQLLTSKFMDQRRKAVEDVEQQPNSVQKAYPLQGSLGDHWSLCGLYIDFAKTKS